MVQPETGPETAPLHPRFKGITTSSSGGWQIMGLDPSPELLAISMGKPCIMHQLVSKAVHEDFQL